MDETTYYGRPQLKPAPFKKSVVGGYVFLAGVSGAAQLLGTLLDLTRGRAAGPTVRRARGLALLAPTIGSALLVYDLHTPERFYNMLRVVKRTSPMSIGTWILSAFTGFSFLAALGGRTGRVAQVPAAIAGAGLGVYTAGLLSSTSAPLWAVAPRALSVRFAASSVASGAAALALATDDKVIQDELNGICAAALALELAASAVADTESRQKGTDRAQEGIDGKADRFGALGAGILLPLGMFAAGLLTGRSREVSGAASLAVLAGSLTMRIATIGAGQESARRPDVSLGFTREPQAGSITSHSTCS